MASLRLSKIRLSGFKSFVDPLTINFPGNLTAVLGPNGCGKSNIIDAVKFVFGARSDDLRGDKKEDVIFNGSDQRKPVGRASVALIFDNSEFALGGEYASFAEIEIKREITRDGDTKYFLNGTQCRRKDIYDIFYGTGLGPKSDVAIITQGSVGELTEAKPEVLRGHIEEAAGISKYKERRRETENRLRHTQDNMDRLLDIQEEIGRQLAHLEIQANQANRYHELKGQEHQTRGQLLGLRYSQYEQSMALNQEKAAAFQFEHVSATTALNLIEQNMVVINEKIEASKIKVHDSEQNVYQMGTEIVRVEQEIKYTRENQQQTEQNLVQTQTDLAKLQEEIQALHDNAEKITAEMAALQPALEEKMARANEKASETQRSEENLHTWQKAWDEFNEQAAMIRRDAEVQKTTICHLESQIQELQDRKQRLSLEYQQNNHDMGSEIAVLEGQIQESNAKLFAKEAELATTIDKLKQNKFAQQEWQTRHQQLLEELQQLNHQHSSLTALQKVALHAEDEKQHHWLEKHALTQSSRLAQVIKVTPGYERAVEAVLGASLEAICLDDFATVHTLFAELPPCDVHLFHAQSNADVKGEEYLGHYVQAPFALGTLFAGIYICDDLAAAEKMLTTLASHESVVTRDGIWLNSTWLHYPNQTAPLTGVLVREHELQQTAHKIEQFKQQEQQLLAEKDQYLAQQETLEQAKELQQAQLAEIMKNKVDLEAKLGIYHHKVQEIRTRQEKTQEEMNLIDDKWCQAMADCENARLIWSQALAKIEFNVAEHERLTNERTNALQYLQQIRGLAQSIQQEVHTLNLQYNTLSNQKDNADKQRFMYVETRERLQQTIHELQQVLGEAHKIENMQSILNDLLSQRETVTLQLNGLREQLTEIEQARQQQYQAKESKQQELQEINHKMQQIELSQQTLRVQLANLDEQILEFEFTKEEIEQLKPEHAKESELERALNRIKHEIETLGAVNLAAIEEYKVQAERKTYLDQQQADLTSALESLKAAIAQIDEETKERFKDTFEQINRGFGELFSKIFQGGRAALMLTEEDLLTAGVHITAQPPGKKNSSIHLLSGGEKALTAIALVFAIFQLNPAPFCLLDEVDAPLDDANVTRFCNLVKEMAQHVQFIYISHNKISMEMADQLIGITMQEPGVSRIVAVNMETALQMAGA